MTAYLDVTPPEPPDPFDTLLKVVIYGFTALGLAAFALKYLGWA